MRCFLFIFCLLLGACGYTGGLNLGRYPDPDASPSRFIVCHGYGCLEQTTVGLRDHEWNTVRQIFKTKSTTAESERHQIAQAIALIEQYTGAIIGTDQDLPKAPIIKKSDKELDCIDETVNTTKYLKFLADDGLLAFHKVGNPVYKGFGVNGVYPHNSATVVEIQTGHVYVIDSYIYKNGSQPNVRNLDHWLKYSVEEQMKMENLNRATLERISR